MVCLCDSRDSPTTKMSPWKISLLVLALVVYIITLVMNALAGRGSQSGPFYQSVGNISKKYDTELTPAGWTFSIWGVIYTWQAVWLLYACIGLCRRHWESSRKLVDSRILSLCWNMIILFEGSLSFHYNKISMYDWNLSFPGLCEASINSTMDVETFTILLYIIVRSMMLLLRSALTWMPSILSCPFYIIWITNNLLNIGWLFLWDREYIIPALAFLALIAFTNYVALFFTYRALHTQLPWMQKYRKIDMWLVRILIQNGLAVYATWTTIATLINFAVVLTYSGCISNVTSGTVSLSILAFEVILWSMYHATDTGLYKAGRPKIAFQPALCYHATINFSIGKKRNKFYLENVVFDQYVRYTLTVYPVVIVALSGSLDKNYNAISPTRNNIYIATLLAVACTAFAARIIIVTWKHFKHPLHQNMEH